MIKDGKGTGNIAEVNEINQLSVSAMTQPEVSIGSDLGVSWIAAGSVTNGLSGIERTVMIITNSGPTEVELGMTITSIQNGAVGAGPTQSGVVTSVKTYIGVSTATGSGVTPVNMNTMFTTLPTVGVAHFAPTVTVSDQLIQQILFQNTDTLILDYQNSIILSPGGSYRVTSTPMSTPLVSGYLVTHSVRFNNEFH